MYRYVAVLVATASLGGCANLVSTGSIRAAEAKWLENGFQDYSFTLLVESEMAQRFGSIPQIFATIRSNRQNRPPRFLVSFENSLGYPESIDANYSRW